MQGTRRAERFLHGVPPLSNGGIGTMHRLMMAAPRMVGAILIASLGCRPEPSQSTGSAAVQKGEAPTTSSQQLAPDDGQWLRPAKDLASTRFSALTEIDATTVKRLHVIATFSTGVVRGHEAAPVVAGHFMYLVTPFPNYVYALDLSKPGFPIAWQFFPK